MARLASVLLAAPGGATPVAGGEHMVVAEPPAPSGRPDAWSRGIAALRRQDPGPRAAWWCAAPGGPPRPPAALIQALGGNARLGAITTSSGTLFRGAALAAIGHRADVRMLAGAGWLVGEVAGPRGVRVPPRMARPFAATELRPVPAGWSVRPPDFIGAGTGKAGTSWWYSLLLQHPSVVPNRLGEKELHWFCHFGLDGPSDADKSVYQQAFAAPPGGCCGEFSGNILHYPLALRWIQETVPNVKLLVMIRNPVDRAVSALNQFQQARARMLGVTGDAKAVLDTFSLLPEALKDSKLAPQLEELFDRFPRERVLVQQYEACRANPEAELRRTWAFLGLPDAAVPPDLRRPVNKRSYTVGRATPAQRAVLADWFHRDVARVFALLPGLDRTLWPDFVA